MKLTLIGTTKSRAFRPLWLLEELGVPFEHRAAAPRSDEIRAVNPSGKLPALIVDGSAITDSTAILHFLADAHGRFTAPAGTLGRAHQDAAMQMALDEMDSVLWTAARHSFVLPENLRLPAVKDSLKWEFAQTLTRVEARLAECPHIGGGDFSIADIVTAHCLRWAEAAGFPLDEAPAARAYRDRMLARPAAVRAAARS